MQKLLQAKTIKIPCMRAGLCQYKQERVLVPQATLEKLAKTAYGIPVIIDHQEDDALKAALARGNFDDVAVGRVADMHYDTETDLWWAHIVVDTQEALDLFAKGHGVSTSYEVTEDSEGGTFNAVPYDRTIENGVYMHLAIVEKPRYEIAIKPVFFNSADEMPSLTLKQEPRTIESIPANKETGMFKLFKTTRQEVKENSDDMMIEVDGKQVAMNELIEAYKNSCKKNEDTEGEEKKPENEVEIEIDEDKPANEGDEDKTENEDDEDIDAQVNALLASVEEEEKKNADEAKAKEEEEKKNAEEKEKAEEEAKKNRYNSLNNAADRGTMQNSSEPVSLFEKAEIGRKRYGSK